MIRLIIAWYTKKVKYVIKNHLKHLTKDEKYVKMKKSNQNYHLSRRYGMHAIRVALQQRSYIRRTGNLVICPAIFLYHRGYFYESSIRNNCSQSIWH